MIVTALHIHHAVIPAQDYTGENGPDCVARIRDMHVKGRGWSDIGYHFIAFRDGTWLTGRDIHRKPASASGHNGKYDFHPVAICCFADFRTDPVEDGFVRAVADLRSILNPSALTPPLPLIPHRAMQATFCPMEPADWERFVKRVEAESWLTV